ncbi:MAG TPA: S41 family peptidase [Planctomycetota bacterium]|nr:S41 family peptidase [Planctomycetota bacterium]
MKSIRYQKGLNVVFLIVLLAMTFLVGKSILEGRNFYAGATAATTSASQNNQKTLQDIENIYQLIKDNFFKEPNKDQVFESAIKGMVSGLDPYSQYMDADEYNDFVSTTKGEYGGIGVEITVEDGIVTVIAPFEDTPAFRAGLLPGDKILEINGETTEGLSVSDCSKKVRGKPGTTVTLKILHKDADATVDITLVREIINMKSIKDVKIVDRPARIGYLRVTAFQEDTADLFDEALKNLQGKQMKSLIIDLRFNGGGLMDAALKMANRFIPSGILISLKGKTINEEIKADSGDKAITATPIVILVNGSSASASEILAGSLKDYHRATLIGSHTYGKGSVQSIFTIRDAKKNVTGAVKLTTARYYTPSGRCLERDKGVKDFGLEPDILVEMSPQEEAKLLKTRLNPASKAADPTDERAGDPDEDTADFTDVQLERAIKFLQEGK